MARMSDSTIAADVATSKGEFPICKRCKQEEATQKIRSEKVCNKCLVLYVSTKLVKRMETYRVRPSASAPKRLLLPLSFGPSSASMLYVLDRHLQGQYDRIKWTAYELHVLHIDQHTEEADRESSAALLEKYKARFPRHSYSIVGLEEAIDLESIDWKVLNVSRPAEGNVQTPGAERLQKLITSMPSATSRADIVTTLFTRLLVEVGKRNGCEAILFGDSTTRLAEKTITQTAKGRGFSLPWQVADGMTPYGIAFNYPVRDLLKKEMIAFSSLTTPSLEDLIIHQASITNVSASSKSTTIDDLMSQYFESVEENYPSIVANVVRTSNKLQPLSGNETISCSLCGLPVTEGTDGIFGWGGDQNSVSRKAQDDHNGVLCYGCSRSING